jgi:predicted dehydrogenase
VDGLQVVAGADPDPARRRAAADALGLAPTFASLDELLDGVACDAVVVAAPPRTHAGLVTSTLGRGLHVICEKPLVLAGDEHAQIARAIARSCSGVVSVHQYGCARPWRAMVGAARTAAWMRRPFTLQVKVRRPGPDPLAATGWRKSPSQSGGMLADHGVHYLALAWAIDERLNVLAVERVTTSGSEQCDVLMDLGSGTAWLRLESGAPGRSTSVTLLTARGELSWDDRGVAASVSGRCVWRRRSEGLASRAYIDSLYASFYRGVAAHLGRDPTWEARRTAETLVVSRTLVGLLDNMSTTA